MLGFGGGKSTAMSSASASGSGMGGFSGTAQAGDY